MAPLLKARSGELFKFSFTKSPIISEPLSSAPSPRVAAMIQFLLSTLGFVVWEKLEARKSEAKESESLAFSTEDYRELDVEALFASYPSGPCSGNVSGVPELHIHHETGCPAQLVVIPPAGVSLMPWAKPWSDEQLKDVTSKLEISLPLSFERFLREIGSFSSGVDISLVPSFDKRHFLWHDNFSLDPDIPLEEHPNLTPWLLDPDDEAFARKLLTSERTGLHPGDNGVMRGALGLAMLPYGTELMIVCVSTNTASVGEVWLTCDAAWAGVRVWSPSQETHFPFSTLARLIWSDPKWFVGQFAKELDLDMSDHLW